MATGSLLGFFPFRPLLLSPHSAAINARSFGPLTGAAPTPEQTLFGAMVTPESLKNPAFQNLVQTTCDVLVVGSGIYWDALEAVENVLDFRRAQGLVDFATTNNMAIRGHYLVGPASVPGWASTSVTKQNALEVLNRRINVTMAQYRGQVAYWNVLNEVISPKADSRSPLRDYVWLDMLGSTYIESALKMARTADPAARIGYNEFGIADDTKPSDDKRAAVLTLLRGLKSSNVPIDYLGVESHLHGGVTYSKAKLGNFLKSVSDLGLRVLITELDVDDRQFPGDIAKRDVLVADTYKRFLDIVLDAVSVDMITCWGLSDMFRSWPQQSTPRSDGLPQRSLPFDDQLRPKPAWQVLVDFGWKRTRARQNPSG